MNKLFRFYSMFTKWYSVVIKWYSMKKKIIEYPRFSQYSALFNVIRAYKLIFIGKIAFSKELLVKS